MDFSFLKLAFGYEESICALKKLVGALPKLVAGLPKLVGALPKLVAVFPSWLPVFRGWLPVFPGWLPVFPGWLPVFPGSIALFHSCFPLFMADFVGTPWVGRGHFPPAPSQTENSTSIYCRTKGTFAEVQKSGTLSSLWLGDQHGGTIIRAEPLVP
jgi:hypothetical protein